MKKFMILIFVVLIQTIYIGSANAWDYRVNVHGIPITCTASNGQLVPFYTDRNAAQAARRGGGARADFTPNGYQIALDLNFMNSLSPLGALFTVFHECAHVALPMGVGLASPRQERNADCHAIGSMKILGLIRYTQEVRQAMSFLFRSGGGHQINRQRIQAATSCL